MKLTALHEDGRVRAPTVGLWWNPPPPGSLVRPGTSIGKLEILGVLHELVAPPGALGVVAGEARRQAPVPVEYGTELLILEAAGSIGAQAAQEEAAVASGSGARLQFCAPLSGRFYSRPSPDKPVFVSVGDEITRGQTVALLEVMKTFNRLTYGGEGLPDRARVTAILPENEDDLEQGAPILALEPLDAASGANNHSTSTAVP
jgi:acetyl-CoA carboxylase biotin carboxyl carrier protein